MRQIVYYQSESNGWGCKGHDTVFNNEQSLHPLITYQVWYEDRAEFPLYNMNHPFLTDSKVANAEQGLLSGSDDINYLYKALYFRR